jgi:ABC-type Fe3+-hydroxamate transport system substrate-binding protein
MKQIIDQLHNKIILKKTPTKIVSVVPSITEYLAYLGLEKEVIGITKFCIRPDDWFENKTRIGGTKKLHIKKIIDLSPDIIFANKEENTHSDINLLQSKIPVYISDISNVQEAFKMMQDIGNITNTKKKANELIVEIKKNKPAKKKLKSSLYLIWQKPYMCAGSNTFINDMMRYAGYKNCISQERYPQITLEEIKKINPEYILLSSEPFPFKKKHHDFFQNEFPDSIIKLVDGELYSWYGNCILKAFKSFSN